MMDDYAEPYADPYAEPLYYRRNSRPEAPVAINYSSYDQNPNSFLDRWSSPPRRPASPLPMYRPINAATFAAMDRHTTFAAAMRIKKRATIHSRLGGQGRGTGGGYGYSPRGKIVTLHKDS
jgi:hypothetical protein